MAPHGRTVTFVSVHDEEDFEQRRAHVTGVGPPRAFDVFSTSKAADALRLRLESLFGRVMTDRVSLRSERSTVSFTLAAGRASVTGSVEYEPEDTGDRDWGARLVACVRVHSHSDGRGVDDLATQARLAEDVAQALRVLLAWSSEWWVVLEPGRLAWVHHDHDCRSLAAWATSCNCRFAETNAGPLFTAKGDGSDA